MSLPADAATALFVTHRHRDCLETLSTQNIDVRYVSDGFELFGPSDAVSSASVQLTELLESAGRVVVDDLEGPICHPVFNDSAEGLMEWVRLEGARLGVYVRDVAPNDPPFSTANCARVPKFILRGDPAQVHLLRRMIFDERLPQLQLMTPVDPQSFEFSDVSARAMSHVSHIGLFPFVFV